MSRVGRAPIAVPSSVTVTLDGATVNVKGPQGSLERQLPEGITVGTLEFKDGKHYSLSGNAPVEKSTDLTDFNEALRKSVLNGAPMFEDLTIPVVKLNPGGTTVSWSFSGELARAEEVK